MLRILKVPEIPSPPPPPQPSETIPVRHLDPPMVFVAPTWEYQHLCKPPEAPVDETELNALGAEGWELAGVSTDAAGVHFYFKRQLR
jgi:hypothetical protein